MIAQSMSSRQNLFARFVNLLQKPFLFPIVSFAPKPYTFPLSPSELVARQTLGAARFAHDVIALAAFGVDVDSVSATAELPCKSFDAMTSKTSAIDKLILKPLDMYVNDRVLYIRAYSGCSTMGPGGYFFFCDRHIRVAHTAAIPWVRTCWLA